MNKKIISELNRSRELMGLKLINEQQDIERDEEGNPRPGDGCAAKNLCDDPNNPGECIECEEGGEAPDGASGEEIEDVDILVDDDIAADVDENELTDDEDSWVAERWEDLTDAVRNVFRRNKKFSGCKPTKSACPSFNGMNRRRKLRILSNLTKAFPKFRWPKFRFRLPDVNMALMMWKLKRRHKKSDRQWRKFKKQHKNWG
jgi:hypothetical protein